MTARNLGQPAVSLVRMLRPWRSAISWFLATFVLTHLLTGAYLVAGGSWSSPSSFVVANALMLCPGAVAVGACVLRRRPVAATLGVRLRPNPWFVTAWLMPPLIAFGALGVALLLPDARFAPALEGLPPEMEPLRAQIAAMPGPTWFAALGLGLVLGPTLNVVGALGEELGWRGYLFEELRPLGFVRGALVTGALWTLWHVPLLFEGYGDRAHPIANAFGLLAFAALLAPVLHHLRERSGSVIACAVFHGTMSSSRFIAVGFVRDAGPLANGALPLVLLVANLVVFVARSRGAGLDERRART